MRKTVGKGLAGSLEVMSPHRLPKVAAAMLLIMVPAALVCAVTADLRLSFDNLTEWQEKSFKGHTSYSLEQHEGKNVLRAQSAGTASGLYHKVTVHSADRPILRWSWKVLTALAAENPYRKDGDDFAARVYVVFPGRFFWQTRALVYVWSDKLPVGKIVPNAFTGNAAIIAVQSGNRNAGTWRQESRNYVEDYRAAFNTAPPDPVAVAVMTDTDNTGSKAVAWYGNIAFAGD